MRSPRRTGAPPKQRVARGRGDRAQLRRRTASLYKPARPELNSGSPVVSAELEPAPARGPSPARQSGWRLDTSARQDLKARVSSSGNLGKKIGHRISLARGNSWRTPNDAARCPAAEGPLAAAACGAARRATAGAAVSASCASPRAGTSLIRAPRASHACGSRRPGGQGRGSRPGGPPHAAGSAPYPPGRSR